MQDQTEVTRAQNKFLAAFHDNPAGPPAQDWPTPGILRRWLKKRRFREALAGVRSAIRFQTDFHLANAAATAARALQAAFNPSTAASLDPDALADLSKTLKALTDLLRLDHLRERFASDAPRRSAEKTAKPRPRLTSANSHGWENILHDPTRLKNHMLYEALRGGTRYDHILSAAFPEELAQAREQARRASNEFQQQQQRPSPTDSASDPP